MFSLTEPELELLVSQFVIRSQSYTGSAYPIAYREQGVAMLSGVRRSDRATDVNIAIMRTFVQMCTWVAAHRDLPRNLEAMEDKYDKNFHAVFLAIRNLMITKEKPLRPIGFSDA